MSNTHITQPLDATLRARGHDSARATGLRTEQLDALGEQLRTAGIEELPHMIGHLEALKAVAWSRMTDATARSAAAAAQADANLSVEEAARRLGISRGYLYRHAHRFPFTVKIGRRLLFSTRGLDKWLLSRRG